MLRISRWRPRPSKFLLFLEVANVLGSAVLYARNVSEGPTAILSSGRVSCSSSSSDIPDPLRSCVCKADELSIRKGMSGKYRGDFTPRWVKREQRKKKKPCCVPGCLFDSDYLILMGVYLILMGVYLIQENQVSGNGNGYFFFTTWVVGSWDRNKWTPGRYGPRTLLLAAEYSPRGADLGGGSSGRSMAPRGMYLGGGALAGTYLYGTPNLTKFNLLLTSLKPTWSFTQVGLNSRSSRLELSLKSTSRHCDTIARLVHDLKLFARDLRMGFAEYWSATYRVHV